MLEELRWIPCSERLPEDNLEVLVCLYNGSPYIAWVCDGEWHTEDFVITESEDEPIAWMPIPTPYESEE